MNASTLLQSALQDPHGPRNPFTREILSADVIDTANKAIAASHYKPPMTRADRGYARSVLGTLDAELPRTLVEASAWAKTRKENAERGLIMCARLGEHVCRQFNIIQHQCYISAPAAPLMAVARVLRLAYQCGTTVRQVVAGPLLDVLRSDQQRVRMRHTVFARGSNLAFACLKSSMERGASLAASVAARRHDPVEIEADAIGAVASIAARESSDELSALVNSLWRSTYLMPASIRPLEEAVG
jgi:hypothetical protein